MNNGSVLTAIITIISVITVLTCFQELQLRCTMYEAQHGCHDHAPEGTMSVCLKPCDNPVCAELVARRPTILDGFRV